MAPVDDRTAVAHLYRRAGFGARPDEVDRAVARGYTAAVDDLVAGASTAPADPPPKFAVSGAGAVGGAGAGAGGAALLRQDAETLTLWWLDRLVGAAAPLTEKLTLLWHGHFATGIQKVRLATYMFRQNELFRTLGLGSFESLTQAVAKDPAMLVWLDSNTNKKDHPNENFARELMELFTLGLGNYAESDVKEAARCFTGWTLDRTTDGFRFRPAQHDTGVKSVLGHQGNFGGEDVITLLTHSPASARFVVAKLWSHLAYPVTPGDPVIADLTIAYARDLDIRATVRGILLHPAFLSDQARSGLVKQPIEYVVGALRAFGLRPSDHRETVAALTALGQTPFNPPNVGGWPQNGYWLSTASALTRLRFAVDVAAKADLSALSAMAPADRVDGLARMLSVEWGPTTRAALGQTTDPRGLVALGLTAPEYVLN